MSRTYRPMGVKHFFQTTASKISSSLKTTAANMSYALTTQKRKFQRTLESIKTTESSRHSKKPRVSTSDHNLEATSKPLPNYLPGEKDQFKARLRTFQNASYWKPKDTRINEVAWAKRGWSCVGPERVQCRGGCEKQVVVRLENEVSDHLSNTNDTNALEGSVQAFAVSEGHADTTGTGVRGEGRAHATNNESTTGNKFTTSKNPTTAGDPTTEDEVAVATNLANGVVTESEHGNGDAPGEQPSEEIGNGAEDSDLAFAEALTEKYQTRIVEGHAETCNWRHRGCDDTIQRIRLLNRSANLDHLHSRYIKFVEFSSELPDEIHTPDPDMTDNFVNPLINELPDGWLKSDAGKSTERFQASNEPNSVTPDQTTTEAEPAAHTRVTCDAEPARADKVTNEVESDEPTQVNNEDGSTVSNQVSSWRDEIDRKAMTLALFGWEIDEKAPFHLATCPECFRRLVFSLYKASKEGSPARHKLNAMTQHNDWCPWISDETQGGNLAGWMALIGIITGRHFGREEVGEEEHVGVERTPDVNSKNLIARAKRLTKMLIGKKSKKITADN